MFVEIINTKLILDKLKKMYGNNKKRWQNDAISEGGDWWEKIHYQKTRKINFSK